MGFYPHSSKIQIGTFWLYHEKQQDAKEKVQKHTNILKFYVSQSNLVFLRNWPLQHHTQCTYENSLSFFFSADISMEELFLYRLQHLHHTVLLFCLVLHRHLCHQNSRVIHPATWIAYVMLPFPQEENNIYDIISFIVVMLLFFQVHMLSDVL